jgi:hypothetical protein
MPASLIDFAMHVGAQFFADGPEETILHFRRPVLGHDSGKRAVELVMIVGDFDFFDAQRQNRHIVHIAADDRQAAGFGRPLEGDGIAAFAVPLFEVRRENQPNLRQRRHNGRRNGGDGVVQILAQVLFGNR